MGYEYVQFYYRVEVYHNRGIAACTHINRFAGFVTLVGSPTKKVTLKFCLGGFLETEAVCIFEHDSKMSKFWKAVNETTFDYEYKNIGFLMIRDTGFPNVAAYIIMMVLF